MAMRQKGQKTYTTMQGKQVDMDLLRKKNELTPAVGNARVNARGDQLGPGGKIIKNRDEVIRDYYEEHPQAAPDEVAQVEQTAEVAEPVQTKAQKKSADNAKKAKAVEETDADDDWVEDDEGNFVKRGE